MHSPQFELQQPLSCVVLSRGRGNEPSWAHVVSARRGDVEAAERLGEVGKSENAPSLSAALCTRSAP